MKLAASGAVGLVPAAIVVTVTLLVFWSVALDLRREPPILSDGELRLLQAVFAAILVGGIA